MNRTPRLAALALSATVLLAACAAGGTDGDTDDAVSSAPPAAIASSGTASAAKVSANSANATELVAALTAAGVTNADRWADEIMEYRPYDAGDASLSKLSDNLAKYNPDPATLAAILSVLVP